MSTRYRTELDGRTPASRGGSPRAAPAAVEENQATGVEHQRQAGNVLVDDGDAVEVVKVEAICPSREIAIGEVVAITPFLLGSDPDLRLYRQRRLGLLRRCHRLSVEVGRPPSLLGREFWSFRKRPQRNRQLPKIWKRWLQFSKVRA